MVSRGGTVSRGGIATGTAIATIRGRGRGPVARPVYGIVAEVELSLRIGCADDLGFLVRKAGPVHTLRHVDLCADDGFPVNRPQLEDVPIGDLVEGIPEQGVFTGSYKLGGYDILLGVKRLD